MYVPGTKMANRECALIKYYDKSRMVADVLLLWLLRPVSNPNIQAHIQKTFAGTWSTNLLGFAYPTVIFPRICVNVATVKRTVKLYNQTGRVGNKEYDKSHLPRKLTETVKYYIIQLSL